MFKPPYYTQLRTFTYPPSGNTGEEVRTFQVSTAMRQREFDSIESGHVGAVGPSSTHWIQLRNFTCTGIRSRNSSSIHTDRQTLYRKLWCQQVHCCFDQQFFSILSFMSNRYLKTNRWGLPHCNLCHPKQSRSLRTLEIWKSWWSGQLRNITWNH